MIRDRFHALRDRLLADPVWREPLARLPFGRARAARHTRELFGLVGGFVFSQTLAAGIELGLFDLLRKGPMSVDRLGRNLGLPPAGRDALVQALLAAGLLERRGTAIGLSINGLVIASDPGIAAMIGHNGLLYRDLTSPAAVFMQPGSGELARFWPYAGHVGESGEYSELMRISAGFVVPLLLSAVRFARYRAIIDVGGGTGTLLQAIAREAPRAELHLADLPAVAALARERLAAEGGSSAICVHDLPEGAKLPVQADCILFSRLLHDRDDDEALRLLAVAAAALLPGGQLIVAEPMAGAAGPEASAYFAAYFAALGSGRLREPHQIDELAVTAGLRPQGRLLTPSPLLAIRTYRTVKSN